MPDYKPNITPPECKPLTLDVAMDYLRLHTWTTREAVLILNLIDPRSNILNDVDFDDDDDDWDVNLETYELAARRFNKASKPLPVERWLTWAIKGTEEEPRRQPLPYAEKMLEARRDNDPERLRGLSAAMDTAIEALDLMERARPKTGPVNSDKNLIDRASCSVALAMLKERMTVKERNRGRWSRQEEEALLILIDDFNLSQRSLADHLKVSPSTISERYKLAKSRQLK